MQIIKLNFVDFWKGFDPVDNYFVNALKDHFEVTISPDPDVLFFSFFGTEHFNYNCHKIQFLGENTAPDYRITDYAISFDYLQQPNHLRLPLYAMLYDKTPALQQLLTQPNATEATEILQKKEGFCSFVVSSKDTQSRIDFFHKLSAYKKVASGGGVLNNIGGRVADKMAFISQYKFNIAFENAMFPGYVTEKLIEAKCAGTIPIYCGNPRIAEELNPKSFINYHDYQSFGKLLQKVIETDQNDDLYKEYLLQPLFYNNQLNEYFDASRFVDFFKKIVQALPSTIPVSKTLSYKFNSIPVYYKYTKHTSRKKAIPYRPDW